MTEHVALDGDEEAMRAGLLTLVLALVEVVVDSLEREAVRRMEAGQLSDAEIERVGMQLQRLEAEIERLEREEGIDGDVTALRDDLDALVDDALWDLFEREGPP